MAALSEAVLLLIALLAAPAFVLSAFCPRIVSRSEWGARPPRSVAYLANQPVPYAFIHHSSEKDCFNWDDCVAELKFYQHIHMDINNWDDLGYSFLIGGDGTVFEGRGWDRVGAHTAGKNSVGLGFCFIGNFIEKLPTKVQMDAVKDLLQCGVSLGKLQANYTLRGHRDMNPTECPGNKLYQEIQTWPHYH